MLRTVADALVFWANFMACFGFAEDLAAYEAHCPDGGFFLAVLADFLVVILYHFVEFFWKWGHGKLFHCVEWLFESFVLKLRTPGGYQLLLSLIIPKDAPNRGDFPPEVSPIDLL